MLHVNERYVDETRDEKGMTSTTNISIRKISILPTTWWTRSPKLSRAAGR